MAKEKVLIIDDNPVIVRMSEALLKSQDFGVICAQDGERGLRMARDEKPDIIFLDIILPQMHGFEVCKRLKTDPATRSIPLVIISGTGLQDIVEKEPDIPADAYLSKPFGLPDILAAIEKARQKVKKN